LENETYFSNHLFALPLPEQVSPNKLKTKLNDKKIIISCRDKYLRVSVNIFNDSEDIQQLINAIQATIT